MTDNPNMRETDAEFEKLAEKAAREFCKDWPYDTYHPNDLTLFYEKGAVFGREYAAKELEEMTANSEHWHREVGRLLEYNLEIRDQLYSLKQTLNHRDETITTLRKTIASEREELASLKRQNEELRKSLNEIPDFNRRRGYPTGIEWTRLVFDITEALAQSKEPKDG